VLLIHGLAEHSGRYERTGSILGAAGLDVTGLDLEGFGGSGGRRAWIPGWDTWLDDVEDRLEAIRASVDGRPVILFGHSMGGLVSLTYAESDRPQPDLLVLSSPWLAYHLPIWRRAGAQVLGRVVPTLEVANGFDGSTLSRDPAVGEAYLADHTTARRRAGTEVLAAQKRANADLGRLRIPTFVTHGGADPLVPTASSEAPVRSLESPGRSIPTCVTRRSTSQRGRRSRPTSGPGSWPGSRRPRRASETPSAGPRRMASLPP
jgi:lysophospholipase